MACLRQTVRCCCITLPIFLWDGLRLLLYTLVLAPAFVRFAWYYFVVADRVVVKYDTESMRQTLDVYWPRHIAPTNRQRSGSDDSQNSPEQSLLVNEISPTRPNRTSSSRVATPHANPTEDVWFGHHPVVFFCCGGAWMIGYKMWGALLARVLTAAGLIVILPDYRNYPWGSIPDQVHDVESALQWTLARCSLEAPSHSATTTPPRCNVVVVGQSAGGHLVLTLLLRKAIEQLQSRLQPSSDNSTTGSEVTPTECLSVAGVICLSAPLDLSAMNVTFAKHGLNDGLIDRMFGGARDDYDPLALLSGMEIKDTDGDEETRSPSESLADYLPPIQVYHGSRDTTVPCQGSVAMVEALKAAHVDATLTMYEGWSHTDPILEGPMDADHRFHFDIFTAVRSWCTVTSSSDSLVWPANSPNSTNPVLRRLCPHVLVQAGRCFMPF